MAEVELTRFLNSYARLGVSELIRSNEQSLGAIGLVITANFVELRTAVADELAGFADVIELFGEL